MTDTASGLRERILTDTFRGLDPSAGFVLVGILFEYRMVLSRTVSKMVQQFSGTFELAPLEPQAAAELVGNLFSLDADQIFLAFQRDWARAKGSSKEWGMIADLQCHEFVDRLEPWVETM